MRWIWILLWFLPAIGWAQIEEYEKERQKMLEEFNKTKKKQKEEFFRFRDEADKIFVKFLRESWKAVNPNPPEKQSEKPKPDEKPVAPADDNISSPIDVKQGTAKPKPPVVHDIAPVAIKPQETAPQWQEVQFEYLGIPHHIKLDKQLVALRCAEVSEAGAALYWAQASNMDYKTTLNQIIARRKELSLNDWGYFQLIQNAAQAALQEREAVLFQWLLLCKSGFAARVGTDGKNFHLLLPIENKVYGAYYYQFGNKNYYLLSQERPQLRIHEKDFPNATLSLSLDITQPLNVPGKLSARKLSSTYGLEVEVPYSLAAIEFYKTYPWSEFRVYFNGQPGEQTSGSLLTALEQAILGKSQYQAVDILLNFVQTSFRYATDQEQFGREKPLFVEETLHYPFSDCEDRSFFFAYLVRKLLKLDVVGVLYPGHLATAVRFTQGGSGDYLIYEGEKYIICDPTYIGASPGMAMPQFQKIPAEIVVLR